MLSCLFITYNRSNLLETSVKTLRPVIDKLGIEYEFIVSDDSSLDTHKEVIETLGFDQKLYSNKNDGLGKNCNKGLEACRMPFIMQLQDDWKFIGKPEDILNVLEILQTDSQIGIVQMNRCFSDLPSETRYTPSGNAYVVFKNDMAPWVRDCGTRPYSDQPHVKRKEFVEKVGFYREGVPMTIMEKDYQKRVANQHSWCVASFSNRRDLFQHLGEEESFNPGVNNKGRLWWFRRVYVLDKAMNIAHLIRRKLDLIAMWICYWLRTSFDRFTSILK